MKTAADVRRARILLGTLEMAEEFRESFEDEEYTPKFPMVALRDINVSEEPSDSAKAQGFLGEIVMPKEMGIEMMLWLESRAREELEKIGVKV